MADRPFLGLNKIVDAPPATAPLHGLIASTRDVNSREADNKWEGGFGFLPETCMELFSWSPYCAASGGNPVGATKATGADSARLPVFVLPFTLYVPFQCTTAGMVSRDDEGRVRRALEAGTPKGLEEEFWEDTLGLGNFSLRTSTPNQAAGDDGGILNAGGVTPTAAAPVKALSMLGQGLADCGMGSRGVIHASVAVVSLWAGLGYLREESGGGNLRLVTKVRGDIVVAGSGYGRGGPEGQADPGANEAWAYATGMVETRVSEIQINPDTVAAALDRRLNNIAYRAERTVAADTDGCCPLAVLVDIS